MMKTKSKIDFKKYEPIDALDKEEQELFDALQSGGYHSVMTEKSKAHYAEIFTESAKREHASTVRLTSSDKLLAKSRAKEEGLPYQVLLASVIHKWLHGKLVER